MQETTLHSAKKASQRAKITIIGGGDPYCAYLLQGMVERADQLKGCHVTLLDSDDEQRIRIYTQGKKLFQRAEIELTLEHTSNEEDAISDATFVISAFDVGGLQARLLDETLPLRHGMIGHRSIGPGGFFATLRATPAVASLAATMEKLAPKAFLLNHAEPNNIITEVITRANGIRVIGVKNDLPSSMPSIASMAGIDLSANKRPYMRTIGLNRASWTTAIWSEGSDILPEIVNWSREYMRQNSQMTAENYIQVMQTTLIARYAALPSYHMPYYYFPEIILEHIRQKQQSLTEKQQTLYPTQDKAQQGNTPHVPSAKQRPIVNDFTLDVLCAILHNTGEEFVLNVPNRGALNFLEDERVVEIPCRVDARGATPLIQNDGGLALDQRGLIVQLAEYAGATAQAALWGTSLDAIKALTANPLVMSYSKAEALYHDLATAHTRYLPARLRP
jgi:6-phospho-beta-glucosidase